MKDFYLRQMEEHNVAKYVLLLPEIDVLGNTYGNKNSLNYVIDSNWCELGSDMIWYRPRSPHYMYYD